MNQKAVAKGNNGHSVRLGQYTDQVKRFFCGSKECRCKLLEQLVACRHLQCGQKE